MSEDGGPSSDDSVSLLCDLGTDQSRRAAEVRSNQSKAQQAADKAKMTPRFNLKCVNKTNPIGETQLHRACRRGDVAAVQALIQAGINVNREDYAGWTALHEACALGDEAVVKELLTAGANINANGCDGVMPLHDAVSAGSYQVVKLLLVAGCNPEDRTLGGLSAFDIAEKDNIKELLLSFRQSQTLKCHQVLSELQNVLTEVLTKQREEKEKLSQKYWKMSDSLRQQVLKGQLLSLASCQRTLVDVLHNHKDFVDSLATTSCCQHSQKRSVTPVSLSEYVLSLKGEGDPPQSPAEDPASPQEKLTTAFLQELLKVRVIHLVGDEERLPNALMDIYWDRVLDRDAEDWTPL